MIDIEKHDGEISDQVNNAGAELREQLEMRCSELIMRVNEESCTLADCQKIAGDLADKNEGSIASVVEKLLIQDAFDGDCAEVLVQTFTTLSDKLHQFKAYADEMKLLDEAKGYLDSSSPLYDVINAKITECSAAMKAAQEKPVPVPEPKPTPVPESVPEPAPVPEPEPIPVPKPEPGESKLKYAMIAGGVVAAAIVAYLVTGGPKPVPVSYSVPAGTKVMIDDKDMGDKAPIKLKPGEHKLTLEHPVIELKYPSSITIEKEGSIKVINGAQLRGDKKAAVENAYKIFMEDLLKNACTSESMRLIPSIYDASADANGKIGKSHKAMRNFAVEQNISSMTTDKISVSDTLLNLSDDNKKAFIKSKAEIFGNAGNDLKIKYVVNADFVVEGQNLKVSSLNAFEAEIAE